jgi:DNA-binding SARP family transcriptional activator
VKAQIAILGPLELRVDDRPVGIVPGKQRTLLVFLTMSAPAVVSTDAAVDALWPDAASNRGERSLQVTVSRLRRSLSDAAALLETVPTGYRLLIEPDDVDAHDFERLVRDGERSRLAGDRVSARRALDSALALWRGPALADVASESFAQGEIRRLEELHHLAREERIEARLADGEHALVVPELEQLSAEHPSRERLIGLLMLALHRCDRQTDALEVYTRGRRRLNDELGLEPSATLRRLQEAILRQDPSLDRPEPTPPAASRVADVDIASADAGARNGKGESRGAFVGRAAQLDELLAGLEAAFAGRGRLFLVSGEPGIGKSRLADELMREAAARGARILTGRCWEAGGAPAYWPWLQALRGYVREAAPELLREQLGAGAADMARILPELGEILPGLPEPPPLDSDVARFRLLYTTAEFLRNVSEARPTVVVLDDLHAADPASLVLLRFLAREVGSIRVLVLGAYRDVDPVPGQPLSEMLLEVAREPGTRRLSLGGLRKPDVMEYVERTAPAIASPELGAALHDESEGNPLFVGETVRLLSLEGIRRDAAGGLRLAIPQNVRAVIARRLTHLSDECNHMLLFASVLGREFPLDALARMGDRSVEELVDQLDEAIAARVVSDVPDDPAHRRFSHILIRDTLYEGLTNTDRIRLHRLAAEALENLFGDSVEGGEPPPERVLALAQQWSDARVPARAISYYRRGGELALRVFANHDAADALTRAIDLLREMPENPRRDEQELELTVLRGVARGWGTPDYARARELSIKLGRAISPPILRGMALDSLLRLDVAGAREHAVALLAAGERDGDPVLIVEGEYLLGVTSFWHGEFPDARRHLEEAVDRYSSARSQTHLTLYGQDPKVVCLSRLAWTLWFLGHPDEAAAARDSALSLADELGHPFSRCYASLYGAIVSQELDDEQARDRLLGTAETLAGEERFEVLSTWGAILRHSSVARQGDRDALNAMGTAIREIHETRPGPLMPYLLALLARACLVAAEPKRGLEAVTTALLDTQRTGARYMESELHRLRGELLATSGAAAADIEAAFSLAHEIASHQKAEALQLRAARGRNH